METHASWPRRALRVLGASLLGLVILFEAWGWRPLARALGALSAWAPVARLECAIARLSPRAALVLFLVPVTLLLPVKGVAVWLLGSGRVVAGLAVLLAAKVVSTSLVARIFLLTRPQLMQLPWFARHYASWLDWQRACTRVLHRSTGWRMARVFRRRLRVLLRQRTGR